MRPVAKRPPPAVIPVAHNAPINGGPAAMPVDPLQAQAQAQIDPLVAALSSRIEARAKAGAGAITGYTNQLAQSLGGQEQHAAGIWGAAQQAQAASDAAQAQRLTGQGAELAAGLSQRLASVNAPAAVGQTTANVQQTGAGAGNALYGTGSAAQGQLIANGAAAQEYASKLPGIARLGGLQSMRDLQLKSQSDLADQTARVQEQIPGIVDTLRQRQEQKRQFAVTRADANRKYRQARTDALSLGRTKATTAVTTAKIKAQEDKWKADVKKRDQAAKDAKPNASLSRASGYMVDSNGNYVPDKNGNPRLLPGYTVDAKGNVVKVASKRTGKTGVAAQYPNLSKSQVVHLRSGIANAYYGVPEQKDANGKVVRTALAPVGYEEAIREAVKAGYSRDAATKMANRFFAPGKRGRPAKPTPDTGFRGAKI